MPKKIFLEGAIQSTIQGDGKSAIRTRLFSRMAKAVDMNGHVIEFRKSRITAILTVPEHEHQAMIEKAEADKKKQEAELAEAKAKADADRAAALAKASEDFIANHGPDPANWPEHMRPKTPAEN